MKKILSLSLLLVLTLFIGTKAIKASGLSFTEGEVVASATLAEGIEWKKYKATSTMDDGTAGKQIVNVAEIAAGAAKIVSWGVPNENGIKATTTLAAAQDFEATYPDYQVVAAINNDYFGKDSTTSVFSMRNTSVIDGVVFREKSQYKQMYGIGITENNEFKLTPRGGQITVSDNYYLDVYDNTNTFVIKTFEISGLNEAPGANETTLIYRKNISGSDFEIFSVNPTSDSKISDCIYLEGKVLNKVEESSTDSISIATSNLEVANAIEKGNKIRVYKTTAGEWAEYDYILGCPAQTMRDGVILSNDEIEDYGGAHVSSRHPRTSIGFKPDGTFVIMTIDGRQSNKEMDGVSERENALALKNLGCTNSFNFDGGGSTTFLALQNGSLKVVNSPSDGSPRSDANHLLVVVPKVNASYNVEQTLKANGKVELSGKVELTGNNGFEYVQANLLVDGCVTNIDALEDFTIELEPNTEYTLGLQVSYMVGQGKQNKPMAYHTIKTIGEEPTEKIVSKPEITFEKISTGFRVHVSFEEGLKYVNKVVIKNEDTPLAVRKQFSSSYAQIASTKENSYTFNIEYSYRTEIGSQETKTVTVNYDFLPDGENPGGEDVKPGGDDVKPGGDDVNPGGDDNPSGDDTPKPTKPSTGGGFNCNFGAYVSSIIAFMSVALIIIKRK